MSGQSSTLDFGIDSAPLVAAVAALDQLSKNANSAAASVASMSTSQQQGASALDGFTSRATAARSAVDDLNTGLTTTNAQMAAMPASMQAASTSIDTFRTSFASLITLMGQVNAYKSDFDAFVTSAGSLGIAAQNQATAVANATAAFQGFTAAGRDVRATMEDIGTSTANVTSQTQLLERFVQTLGQVRTTASVVQEATAVLGPMSPQQLQQVLLPQAPVLGAEAARQQVVRDTTSQNSQLGAYIDVDSAQRAVRQTQSDQLGQQFGHGMFSLDLLTGASANAPLNQFAGGNISLMGADQRAAVYQRLTALPNDQRMALENPYTRSMDAFNQGIEPMAFAARLLYGTTSNSHDASARQDFQTDQRVLGNRFADQYSAGNYLGAIGGYIGGTFDNIFNPGSVNPTMRELAGDYRPLSVMDGFNRQFPNAGIAASFGQGAAAQYGGSLQALNRLNMGGAGVFTSTYGADRGNAMFGNARDNLQDTALSLMNPVYAQSRSDAPTLYSSQDAMGDQAASRAVMDYASRNNIDLTPALQGGATSSSALLASPNFSGADRAAVGLGMTDQSRVYTNQDNTQTQQAIDLQTKLQAALRNGTAAAEDAATAQNAYNAALIATSDPAAAAAASVNALKVRMSQRETAGAALLGSEGYSTDQAVLTSDSSIVNQGLSPTARGVANTRNAAMMAAQAQARAGQIGVDQIGTQSQATLASGGINALNSVVSDNSASLDSLSNARQLLDLQQKSGDTLEQAQTIVGTIAKYQAQITAATADQSTSGKVVLQQLMQQVQLAEQLAEAAKIAATNQALQGQAQSTNTNTANLAYIQTLPPDQRAAAMAQLGTVNSAQILATGTAGMAITQPVAAQYLPQLNAAQGTYGVPAAGIAALLMQESNFGRNVGNNPMALGPGQFNSATWASYGQGGNPLDMGDTINGIGNYLHANIGFYQKRYPSAPMSQIYGDALGGDGTGSGPAYSDTTYGPSARDASGTSIRDRLVSQFMGGAGSPLTPAQMFAGGGSTALTSALSANSTAYNLNQNIQSSNTLESAGVRSAAGYASVPGLASGNVFQSQEAGIISGEDPLDPQRMAKATAAIEALETQAATSAASARGQSMIQIQSDSRIASSMTPLDLERNSALNQARDEGLRNGTQTADGGDTAATITRAGQLLQQAIAAAAAQITQSAINLEAANKDAAQVSVASRQGPAAAAQAGIDASYADQINKANGDPTAIAAAGRYRAAAMSQQSISQGSTLNQTTYQQSVSMGDMQANIAMGAGASPMQMQMEQMQQASKDRLAQDPNASPDDIATAVASESSLEQLTKMQTQMDSLRTTAGDLSSTLLSGFNSAIEGGGRFNVQLGNIFKSLSSIALTAAEKPIQNYLQSAIGNGLDSIFGIGGGASSGWAPAANSLDQEAGGLAMGGVISNGRRLSSYAAGGVVETPRYFPMANGGTGLMGEAGPEAVMPLKRRADGSLGIAGGGGGSSTTVNVYQTIQQGGSQPPGNGGTPGDQRRQTNTIMKAAHEGVMQSIENETRPGGRLARLAPGSAFQ